MPNKGPVSGSSPRQTTGVELFAAALSATFGRARRYDVRECVVREERSSVYWGKWFGLHITVVYQTWMLDKTMLCLYSHMSALIWIVCVRGAAVRALVCSNT